MKNCSLVVLLAASLCITANAHSACSGYGCDGKDPNVEGCAKDATTVKSSFVDVPYAGTSGKSYRVTAELRWSSKCQTNWTRVNGAASSGTAYIIRGTPKSKTYSQSLAKTTYTPMVYGKGLCAKARWYYQWSYAVGAYAETGWQC